ncbi:MAG TPA: hypothetical protein PK264_15365 [Hyphomicrobiaceae bacterium]|nr:hypothetical protein [Hyphomicrobiaceae bacterium]
MAGLTPAEAYALLEPGSRKGNTAIKLTLMWLLSRRVIEIRKSAVPGIFGKIRERDALFVREPLPADCPPYLRRLLAIIDNPSGVRVDRIPLMCGYVYGSQSHSFLREDVSRALIAKGFITRTPRRALGIFPYEQYRRTKAGDQLASEINRTIVGLKSIPDMLERNPRQAAALAFAAGGLIFLVPELVPHFTALAHAARRADETGGDSGVSVPSSSAASSDDDPWQQVDLDTFEALETTFSSFSEGFDSGGGDGGDGGGGGGD